MSLGHSVATVFNSDRQLAMGNIWYALCSGVKAYLNEKSIVYHSLRDNGLMVFPVEQFVSDLEHDNLALDSEHHVVNVEQLTRLRAERSREVPRENSESYPGAYPGRRMITHSVSLDVDDTEAVL